MLSISLWLAQLPQMWVSAGRIREIMSATTGAVPQQPARRRLAIDGTIGVEQVSFRYPGAAQPVLRDCSFVAEPGTTTAIVGSTGVGKSTLIGLIVRSFDVTAGSVMADGVDIRGLDIEQLRGAIGWVPQRAYLFYGTVADNLRFGKADATEAEMWQALRIAAAAGFVAAHPDGLQMQVAQGGINFSGGQRQRLTIARAVIRKPAMYLFDDAFSALDVHTQAEVWSGLQGVAGRSTLIVTTQRVSVAAQADQVIVIEDGTVVGAGNHESLLTSCPIYADFANSQAFNPSGRPL